MFGAGVQTVCVTTTLQRRRRLAISVAVLVIVGDVAEKGLASGALHHRRSLAAFALMAMLAIALVVVGPRLPTLPAALGAGIAAGGAVGNLVSGLVWWRSGVPDPLFVAAGGDAVAFNLADLAVLSGDALLLSAAAVFALRNRHRLRLPID